MLVLAVATMFFISRHQKRSHALRGPPSEPDLSFVADSDGLYLLLSIVGWRLREDIGL
jgi:hypothetical protein